MPAAGIDGHPASPSPGRHKQMQAHQLLEMPKGKLHEGQVRAQLCVKDGGFALGSLAATHDGKVEDKYVVDRKKVGEGGFGCVRKARCKNTGAWRAVKSIARSAVPEPELLREEIDIMRLLDHPHIVRLSETFEDKCWVYIVMELCEGGELFQQICEARTFTEMVAANCTRQMLLAVNYLHQNCIMHRDLKPENFLLAAKGPLYSAILKLIDFGFSKRVVPDKPCETLCGTLLYIAPEVLDEKYHLNADVWSLGVIVYLMLSGRLPWGNPKNDDVLTKAVKAGKISTSMGNWRSISADAKDLVHQLLTKDAKVRPQAVQALQHTWLNLDSDNHSKTVISTCDMAHLKAFGQYNALKKAAADVLVTQLPESEIKELRKMFMQMDTNKDGTVSFAELKTGLEQSGVKLPSNLLQLMKDCDLDGSGVLDYTEFLAATMGKKQFHQKDVVWAAFKRFDVDGSGFIDRSELANVLNEEVKEALHLQDETTNMDRIFAEVDKDHDNRIDFNEFFEMMSSVSRGNPEEGSPDGSQQLRRRTLRNNTAQAMARPVNDK